MEMHIEIHRGTHALTSCIWRRLVAASEGNALVALWLTYTHYWTGEVTINDMVHLFLETLKNDGAISLGEVLRNNPLRRSFRYMRTLGALSTIPNRDVATGLYYSSLGLATSAIFPLAPPVLTLFSITTYAGKAWAGVATWVITLTGHHEMKVAYAALMKV
jgi:hypothetical protein